MNSSIPHQLWGKSWSLALVGQLGQHWILNCGQAKELLATNFHRNRHLNTQILKENEAVERHDRLRYEKIRYFEIQIM